MLSVKKNNYSIIIGCGRLGSSIANILSDNKQDVIIIDRDKSSFRKLSASFGGLTVVGNGADLDVLTEAKIQKSDNVIVVTDNDNTNIIVSQMAKKVFNCKNVISRIYDLDKEIILEGLDINIICPSILSINKITDIIENNK